MIWKGISSKTWIGLLLVIFSLQAAAQVSGSQPISVEPLSSSGDSDRVEARRQLRLTGQAHFEQDQWELAEQNFIACTDNQFAKAMIHDLMEAAENIRPRHLHRAIVFSKLLPGLAYLSVGQNGKAIGNFALLAGIGVGFAVVWPVAASFTLFVAIDWVAQGAARGEKVLRDATERARKRILAQILVLSQV